MSMIEYPQGIALESQISGDRKEGAPRAVMSERGGKTHPAFWRSSVRVIVLAILVCISTME